MVLVFALWYNVSRKYRVNQKKQGVESCCKALDAPLSASNPRRCLAAACFPGQEEGIDIGSVNAAVVVDIG